MRQSLPKIFFDRHDHELLSIVREVVSRSGQTRALRSLLVEYMHPQGIKEMAAPRGLRIAYSIAGLLGSFEQGLPGDRIKALRSLRDEVFHSASFPYQKNTARVLVQIMKELLRSHDDELRQLKLAHDFRMVSTGNPRLVRRHLARYHLLEMPEEWNQYAFDDHVHDANTKGRKSPTHLVMDAWIKGIRYLTVVYYNYVSPEMVEELIEASALLDIQVQVGIEMSAHFRNKYIRFTWEPHGFNDNRALLGFLREEAVLALLEQGKAVSRYQQQYVFAVLKAFNDGHRHTLAEELGTTIEPLQTEEFLRFVGAGQPSILHLARFIHNAVTDKTAEIGRQLEAMTLAGGKPDSGLARQLARLRSCTIENIISHYLAPGRNPEIADPQQPREDPELPELLRHAPKTLLSRLLSLHSSSKFTLNLSNLSVQDTLELLYDCEGMISHIEAFNLKNASHGIISSPAGGCGCPAGDAVDLKSPEQHYRLIGELQQALNDDNVISLKRAIRAIIWDYEEQRLSLLRRAELPAADCDDPEQLALLKRCMEERKTALLNILFNLEKFHNYYRKRTLGSRIGSGSTGLAEHQHGMGLVVLDTLPDRAKKALGNDLKKKWRSLIPVSATLTRSTHSRGSELPDGQDVPGGIFRHFRLAAGRRRWTDWTLESLRIHPGRPGNIATLGGLRRNGENGQQSSTVRQREKLRHPWVYLNTNLKNTLKVLIGFIPAFLTFSLTKDWWLLAYFGAVIWFSITGLRNIIQSVLGGGGLRRSPLLPWNSLVSWSRIADSLLYTGFSVPLLDYLVKTLLLDQGFGVTTASNPILLYAVMGLANGIYISGHNLFRGLPKNAAVGNFFRSILAIPLAVLLNSLFGGFLLLAGVPDVSGELQKWAAIISKFASDCVAAVIEGLADRQVNIRARLNAYRTKISQLFAVFSRLDLLFPEEDVLDILQTPEIMMKTLNYEAREQEKLIIVNALDLMYFWMYQPRSRRALTGIVAQMSREEWLIFYRSQLVLMRYKEISQVFIDGLVGKDFSRALAFYLDQHQRYLTEIASLGERKSLT